jgi:tyrosyl-tRNA synthetase
MLVANLAQIAKLTSSTGEARRLIQSGGVRLNDKVVEDQKAGASLADMTAEGVLKLSIGKKKHVLIKPV